MSAEIVTVEQRIPRDHCDRPLVIPPGGGKPKAYQRVTKFIDCLEDTYNLQQWEKRMVAIGLADREDLLLSVSAHRDDKRKLDGLCKEAKAYAKASAKATTGTALHRLSELVDRGEELPTLPPDAQRDLEAYRAAMAPLRVVAMEQFGVNDDLRVGGTWDRIVEYAGRRFIADLKTGSIDFDIRKIAMQLAVYSRCQAYTADGTRTPLDVDQRNGLVIHLPAGEGRCELHWVDLTSGWEGVELAAQVRAWRKRKGLTAPFRAPSPVLAAVRP